MFDLMQSLKTPVGTRSAGVVLLSPESRKPSAMTLTEEYPYVRLCYILESIIERSDSRVATVNELQLDQTLAFTSRITDQKVFHSGRNCYL